MVNELDFFSCSGLIVETGTPKFSQNISIINMTIFTIHAKYLLDEHTMHTLMCNNVSVYMPVAHKLTNFARTLLSHVIANCVLVYFCWSIGIVSWVMM